MTSRPIAVPRWAVWVLLFGLYLTARGYQSLDGDQAYRLPLLLHRQDPSLFADDPFVRALDAFNPHRGYLALLDLASRPLGLSFGLFALFASTFALMCAGVSRLARAVWPDLGRGVGLVAVVLVLIAKAGNVGTNHLFEPILLDRLIGFALGWLALAWAIEGEIWRPALALGLAAVVHPTVGLQLGMLLGAGWIAWALFGSWTGQSWRATAVRLVILGSCLLPGVLPNLTQGRRLFEGLSAEEFRRIGVELQMAQHMVPSLWRRSQWMAWGGYVVLGLVSLAGFTTGRGGTSPDEVGSDARPAPLRFALLFGVLLIGLGLAYVAVEFVGDLRVTVFQPFRMATIARGLALVALAGRCVLLWTREGIGRARVFVLAAGLTGDWAFVVAVSFEMTISLCENLASVIPPPSRGDGIGSHPKAWKRPVLFVAPFIVLSYGLFFLSRHDTERGHRAIAAALIAATAFPLIARRPAGWTRRRLAFAIAACWIVPAAAMIVPVVRGANDPLAQSLAARCRFAAVPTDDVERLAVWARENTPSDARFITPPGPKTFRLWSGRSVAFNRAASPYHAAGLKDWSDRFRAHVGFEGSTDAFVRAYLADRHGFESRHGRFSPSSLAALAASQGAGYVLASSPGSGFDSDGPLRLLRVEGRYAIYGVAVAGDEALPRVAAERRNEGEAAVAR